MGVFSGAGRSLEEDRGVDIGSSRRAVSHSPRPDERNLEPCLCQRYVRFVPRVVMQRTQRLFALAEYLRGRRTGVTAEVLAERFGVTLRTIYRDLDTLRLASLPLAAER